MPELILEPGVAITANIAYFFTKVLDVRKFGDHQFVLVSGSIHNIKPTLNKFNLPCEVIHAPYNGASLSGTMSIVGYTCMEHDLLFQDFQGTVTVGDYVRFENVGAYTNVMKQPFIRPSPPMLGKRDNTDGFELLKRQETLDDIFASYRF